MKCPNCSGQLGLEDAVCPYCGTPNAMAAKHQADMARFRQEYERTQEDVMQKTSFLQRQGAWLVILAVLLVAFIGEIVLQANAWDIGYSIRTGNVQANRAEDWQAMDAYLEQGDYGKFAGYYTANDIAIDEENPYEGLWTASNAYVDLLQYIAALNGDSAYQFKPEYRSGTCEYIAEDLNRIFTLEQRYSYNTERYLPADKMVYVDDIRDRSAVIAKAYFGLTDEDIQAIPDMSKSKLASLIEEGVAS